jgi:hypothetical protein
MIAAKPVCGLALAGTTLLSLRFVSGIEKAVDRKRQRAIKGAQRRKRSIDKPMPATPFHQLGNATVLIDMHDDE